MYIYYPKVNSASIQPRELYDYDTCRSLLHLAVLARDESEVQRLLAKGVRIREDIFGNTPLHYACSLTLLETILGDLDSNKAIIKLLISGGADPYKKNHRGENCFHIARNELKVAMIHAYQEANTPSHFV